MEATLEAMQLPYLTITEAVKKTQRSSSTIRRVIRSITDSASHPDRSGIEPTTKVVEVFKKKGENFTWTIREDVLLKHLPSAPTAADSPKEDAQKSSGESPSGMEKAVFEILKNELALKNQQIEKQWEVIQSLNDRLREGNILMGSLQQRLALPVAESPTPVVDAPAHRSPAARADGEGGPSMEPSVEAKRASKKKVMEAREKLSKRPPVEASMNVSTQAPKKGVLSWLFR